VKVRSLLISTIFQVRTDLSARGLFIEVSNGGILGTQATFAYKSSLAAACTGRVGFLRCVDCIVVG
jgi:hypothetical protein